MREMIWILAYVYVLCLTVGNLDGKQTSDSAVKVVSQCFRSRGFSFVSLYCGYNKVIQIQRAFHGAHKNRAIRHCGQLEGDCITETTHYYDWSRCEGRHSCVQSITKRPLADCSEEMLYLQVNYDCVEGTAWSLPSFISTTINTPNQRASSRKTTPTTRKIPSVRPETEMGICTNRTRYLSSVRITSPGYPQFYAADTECRCIVKGMPNTKVAVTYQDLALVMRAEQCVDWLLLQSLGFKNSAAVTCGQMAGAEKTLMAKGNWLLLHFHTAHLSAEDNTHELDNQGRVKRNMRGFRVRVTTKPEDKFEVQCYESTPEVLSNLKYKDSKYDVNGNIIIAASDLNLLAADSSESCSMEAHNRWMIVVYSIFIIITVELNINRTI